MKRWAITVVAVAVLTAACTGPATLSQSKQNAAPVGAVQLNGGQNSGDVSDTNRPNPPVHKPGTGAVTLPKQPAVLSPALPAFGSAFDRCGTAIGTGLAGAVAPLNGKHVPKLMCEVQ